MYIEKVPNRNSPPCILLRESFREDGKVRKRTLANLTSLPEELVNEVNKIIKGGKVIEDDPSFDILRSLPYGHVNAVLSTIKELSLAKVISNKPCRELQLVLAMIVSRIINPGSKLAATRAINSETCSSALGKLLELDSVTETDLYRSMDWLLEKQANIENKLAGRHLADGCLVLYDVSSSYFEGTSCSLAKYGYNRDGKKGKLQIVYGLLCNSEGCPVAIEVFEGNTSDPKTIAVQIEKIRARFGLKRVVVVGDRGMLTSARIEDDIKPLGLDWVSALKSPAIRKIINTPEFDRSLLDEQDMAEITHPDFPGERLIVCFNPLLEHKRQKAREELLQATEKELMKVQKAVARKTKPLRGMTEIGLAAGKVIDKHKVGKHFELNISEDNLTWQRKQDSINAEASLDGIYIIRTSLKASDMDSKQTVQAYKQLSQVERAFRSLKTVDLKIRPIYHYLADRVRAHVFLCMLAYYVEWHMREKLGAVLFDDEHHELARHKRRSPVQPARVSDHAEQKAAEKCNPTDGMPVHSFQTLLDDLATITLNTVKLGGRTFDKITAPTPLQQKVLNLLDIKL